MVYGNLQRHNKIMNPHEVGKSVHRLHDEDLRKRRVNLDRAVHAYYPNAGKNPNTGEVQKCPEKIEKYIDRYVTKARHETEEEMKRRLVKK
eukprot:gene615-11940_t